MSDVTPIRPDLPVDPPAPVEIPDCYERLIGEIATLDCLLNTLEAWDLSGRPTDKRCRIGSTELALREALKRLDNIASDVEDMQCLVEKLREVAHG